MNKQEINKYLHGKIEPDGCYHEWVKTIDNGTYGYPAKLLYWVICSCGLRKELPATHETTKVKCDDNTNPDYFTKDGFWDVLEFMEEKHPDGLRALLHHGNKQYYMGYIGGGVHINKIIERINYKTFAGHVYKYLRKGEE